MWDLQVEEKSQNQLRTTVTLKQSKQNVSEALKAFFSLLTHEQKRKSISLFTSLVET